MFYILWVTTLFGSTEHEINWLIDLRNILTLAASKTSGDTISVHWSFTRSKWRTNRTTETHTLFKLLLLLLLTDGIFAWQSGFRLLDELVPAPFSWCASVIGVWVRIVGVRWIGTRESVVHYRDENWHILIVIYGYLCPIRCTGVFVCVCV